MDTADEGARARQPSAMSRGPPAEAATYRDLLIFEERLKQSASRLRKRKRRWETLLLASIASILVLAYIHQFAPPSIALFDRLLTSTLLFLATFVCLFFVSGLYSDRIVAATRYSQQANRALRNLNMHLNLRTAPQRGILSRFFLPFATPSSAGTKKRREPSLSRAPVPRSPSSASLTSSGSAGSSLGASKRHALSGIPPSTNPRGELIFSSRIPIKFRQGYERYRAAFERRRSERLEARRSAGWRFWLYTGAGWGWWRKEIWKPAEAGAGQMSKTHVTRGKHPAPSGSGHRHGGHTHQTHQHTRTTSNASSKSNSSQRRRHTRHTSSSVPPLPTTPPSPPDPVPRPPSPAPSDTSAASSYAHESRRLPAPGAQ